MPNSTQSKNPLMLLYLILLVKAFIMVGIILFAKIGLSPDEAQYFTWSQFLDFGYYSKPPGIAWEIALGTFFLGNTELGVRIMPVIIGTILPLLVYRLAINSKLLPQAAFLSAIAIALSPIGSFASFLAITDGGMILFWTMACSILAASLSKNQTPDYHLVGLCILLGALFKWPIYLFWGFALSFACLIPSLRFLENNFRNSHFLFRSYPKPLLEFKT